MSRSADLLRRAIAWLDTRFRYTKPEPTRLNCGCPDIGARYVCRCGDTMCERHRGDALYCLKETADAQQCH